MSSTKATERFRYQIAWIFALVVFLAGPRVVDAQVRIGVSGGASFFNVSNGFEWSSERGEYDRGSGPVIGGILDVELGIGFSLRLEPTYVRKGAGTLYVAQRGQSASDNYVDYIDVPVLLLYSIPVSDLIVPFIAVGPTVGIKVGAKMHAVISGMGVPVLADISDDVTSVDPGVVASSGVGIRSGRGWIFVSGRYAQSISNMFDNPLPDELGFDGPGSVDLRHRGYQVMIGYLFPLGSRR